MTEIEKKTGMTDAECEYWDDYFTNNPYEPGPNLLELGIKPGFAHKALLLNELDEEVAEYLRVRVEFRAAACLCPCVATGEPL